MSQPEPSRLIRAVFVALGLVAWFGSQAAIGQMGFPSEGLGDALFVLFEPAHAFLLEHPVWADTLLIVSSACIDLLGIFLLASAIFGPTIRPFLGLLLVFAMRQACQALIALPAPEGMIWRYPGFPSLLVTYQVANDFFFSGHTSIAVYGAVELAHLRQRRLLILGVGLATFEAITVLVLRAHYTMDVLAGVAAALLAGIFAVRLAPSLDRFLVRLGRRS